MSDTIKDSKTIMLEGEKIFEPYDESIDKKCYEINKVNNWADYFYGPRTGLLKTLYSSLVLKTENKKFFEGLNYEYSLNNYPLDIKKAFDIYKTAADTSLDYLCMFRLYRIYKNEFTKFNIDKRNIFLEKYYLLKCLAYSMSVTESDCPHNALSYRKLEITREIFFQIFEEKEDGKDGSRKTVKRYIRNKRMV